MYIYIYIYITDKKNGNSLKNDGKFNSDTVYAS